MTMRVGLTKANDSLGNGKAFENSGYDVFRSDVLGFGFIADRYAMTQHVIRKVFHILRRDITATLEERVGTSPKRKANRGTGRSTALHPAIQIDTIRFRITRRQNDVHDVILHLVIDVDIADNAARVDDVFGS